eukprot:scaffold33321_cov20-Tisochrysis_lutea.AAC.4
MMRTRSCMQQGLRKIQVFTLILAHAGQIGNNGKDGRGGSNDEAEELMQRGWRNRKAFICLLVHAGHSGSDDEDDELRAMRLKAQESAKSAQRASSGALQ